MSSAAYAIIDVHNRGLAAHDMELFGSIFADDVAVELPGGTVFAGRDGIIETAVAFYTAFPDIKLTPRQVWADENGIVAEQVFTGTHTGPLATPNGEIPATGKKAEFGLVDTFLVSDGKVTAHRVYYDNLAFMTQLGLA